MAATLAVFSAGCSKKDAEPVRQESAAGELPQTWEPVAVTSVKDIPVAALRAAIDSVLDAKPPAPLSDDTWGHTVRLYKRYAGGPLWLDEKGLVRDRAASLMTALADGDQDALDLAGYPLTALGQALKGIEGNDTPTAQQLALADVYLTASYTALGEDLLTGQVDPASVTDGWHIDPTEERVDSALVRTLRSEPLEKAIATMRPVDEGYRALQDQLKRYREIAAKGGWPVIPDGPLLKPGERAPAARLDALRQRLAAEGFQVAAAPETTAAPQPGAQRPAGAQPAQPTPAAMVYDRGLAAAVATFQARHGIPADSALGPQTVATLNVPVQTRIGQVAANLERHRWLPRSLGSRYIIVNVPAFRVEAYDGGKKELEMKVIVGAEYDGRSTPVFSDTMRFVVFRPYWNVTDNIAENELMPKIQADPGYMARNNYEFFRSEGKQRIRQKPGPENSLGLVKFMFPNSYDIYLHDTPQDDLFDKDMRAFSHGCIRLEKPEEMAQWVLGWDAARVTEAMENGSNDRRVNLPKGIPVYIVYFTAYARDGELFYGTDLYNSDEQLIRAVAGGALPSESAHTAARALRSIAEQWTD